MTLDELKIVLGLDSSSVKKGMKDAENSISSGISSITSKLGALSAAFTAAMSIGAAWNQYINQADAMGKLADALDVDISKMHAWGEAAARAGGSVEAFQGSLQSLTAQLARQATMGTSRAAKLLEGAGIDAGELGRQRDAFSVMMELAEKAETMGKQEFFGLGRALGIDQGTIMLLQQGRDAVKNQIQLQKEFGVYSKEDARVTADFNDRMADLGQVFRSVSSIIFRLVIPPMTKFIEVFNKAVAFIRKHERFVQAFFYMVAAAITTMLIPAFVKLAAVILANPLTWVIGLFTALALAIEDLVVWAEGGESALSDLWEAIFGSPEEAQATWEDIKQGLSELVEFIKPILQWIKDEFIAAFRAIYPWVVRFVRDSKELIVGLKAVFSDLANYIIDTLGRAFNWVIDKWNMVASALGKTKINVSANVVANESNATHGGNGGSFGDFISDKTPGRPPEAQANGGIFTSPVNALIGEAGAEAVIPFSPGKRNRGLELLSKIAENLMPTMPKIEMPTISAAQALPMGGATTNNNITSDTRVNVGTVNISAADGTDAANQFMNGVEQRAQMWTAAANVAY